MKALLSALFYVPGLRIRLLNLSLKLLTCLLYIVRVSLDDPDEVTRARCCIMNVHIHIICNIMVRVFLGHRWYLCLGGGGGRTEH